MYSTSMGSGKDQFGAKIRGFKTDTHTERTGFAS